MSKYDELCQASREAERKGSEYRERCWRDMAAIVMGFVKYCGIPVERVTFLKSNGLPGDQRTFSAPDDGGRYTLIGATEYDKDDDFWNLGIYIDLRPPTILPPRWISFAFFLTEREHKTVVKLGALGKAHELDTSNRTQCEAFYDEVVDTLKGAMSDPRGKQAKAIGFVANQPAEEETAGGASA
jgi:hypothetical protein